MQKTNIVDLAIYRKQHGFNTTPAATAPYNEELVTAIQYLIQRLRKSEPLRP